MFSSAQSSANGKIRKSYDKLDHIQIDKVLYYSTPYSLCAHRPKESSYFPTWYWGYCAKNYPLAFKNYSAEAGSFMFPPNLASETQLKSYETKFKNLKVEDFPLPYEYCYGEIYFTYKKTKKQYLMVLSYKLPKESPDMEFSKIDTLKFKIEKNTRLKNNKGKYDPFEQIYEAPTFINYYVLDSDGVYKEGNNSEIYANIIQEGKNTYELGGNHFNYFMGILNRAPKYVRSYIENGVRYFETAKYTPKGIMVIGKKRKQLDEN